jgi:hypothetical protein
MVRTRVVRIERRIVERATEVNLIWDVRDDGRIGCEMCVCGWGACADGASFLSLCACACVCMYVCACVCVCMCVRV